MFMVIIAALRLQSIAVEDVFDRSLHFLPLPPLAYARVFSTRPSQTTAPSISTS